MAKRKGNRRAAGKSAAARVRKKVAPIPAGYHSVTPYLSVDGAAAAIDFYRKALGAKELMRMPGPDGKVGHAEIRIGDSRVMIADEYPEMEFVGPRARGGTSVHLHIYLPNVDAQVAKAVAAGARLVRPVADQFYGDRTASIEDPFGHVWHLATHTRDVSMAEMKKAAAAKAAQAGKKE